MDLHPTDRRCRYGLILFWLLLSPIDARAWDAVTHRWIATDAWLRLTPVTRQQLAVLMQAHPEPHEALTAAGSPNDPDAARFAALAVWPDRIRDDDPDASSSHRDGHYVNFPLGPGALRAPDPPVGRLPQALAATAQTLANPSAPAVDRAVALAWYAHLVGDAHQPLHVASWFDPAGESDRGGNRVRVRTPDPRAPERRLHALWDAAASPLPRPGSEPQLPDANAPAHRWLAESLGLATHMAYPDPVMLDGPPLTLSVAFMDTLHRTAVQQVRRAAGRLSWALNALFDTP